MRSLGVDVVALPFELHPEIPAEGLSLRERWGARYEEASAMYRRIEAECEAAGLPFRRPERVPNTRRALETAECVRQRHADAFLALDESLFRTHFVEGRFLGDPEVLDELVTAAGAPADEVRGAVEADELRVALRESMNQAHEAGVTGTPAWLLADRFLLPGAQPREVVERVITRLQERLSANS